MRIRAANIRALVGSQTLTEAKIKISMDGRGRYLDNIFHRAALAVPEAGGRVSARNHQRLSSKTDHR